MRDDLQVVGFPLAYTFCASYLAPAEYEMKVRGWGKKTYYEAGYDDEAVTKQGAGL